MVELFTADSDGVVAAGTLTRLEVADGVPPPGEVAFTLAVLSTCPKSRSVWVTVCVAVQVVLAVGARVATGQEIEPVSAFESVTVMDDTVTLPVLVTTSV